MRTAHSPLTVSCGLYALSRLPNGPNEILRLRPKHLLPPATPCPALAFFGLGDRGRMQADHTVVPDYPGDAISTIGKVNVYKTPVIASLCGLP
jgi:hypothetical protein